MRTNRSAAKKSAAAPPPGSATIASASSATIAALRSAVTARGRARAAAAGPARRPARRPWPRARLRRLGGEAVADPEVRVDVAPLRRGPLELLAQLAHEDVHGAIATGHRVAPDALVDLLAFEHAALGGGQQLDELELAAGQLDRTALDEGLELVGPDLHLAGGEGDRVAARLAAPAAAHDGLDAGDDLLRVAGLLTQSSAPSRSPRTRWATVDWPVQTTTPSPGSSAHTRSSHSHPCAPSPARSTTTALSRIDTIVWTGTAPPTTRYSQPRRSRRLDSTCRNPVSRSSTAMRSGVSTAKFCSVMSSRSITVPAVVREVLHAQDHSFFTSRPQQLGFS